jgi:hypothetical protein
MHRFVARSLVVVVFGSVFVAGCAAVGAARGEGNVVVVPAAVVAVDDEAHVDTLRRRIAASNAHDWAAWQALHDPQCVRTAPGLHEPLVGADAMREAIVDLVDAFPDYRVGLVRAVGHGPWLAATLSSTATAPTGARFSQTWTAFVRFDDAGRIVEFHEDYDNLDVVTQLLGVSSPRAF